MARYVTSYSTDCREVLPQACPWCGRTFAAVSQANRQVCEVPQAGAATVCVTCGEVSIFLGTGQVRRAAPDEIDAEIGEVQRAVRRLRAQLS